MSVVFPTGVEVFANSASCVASGSSGTTNPGAGATETWTMGTGYTSFPVAQNTTAPNNFFYVRDPADTTNELVLVYFNNSSGSPGNSWNVQRGMNGATVAHATGATWVQVIAPYTLQNFKQAPGAATSAVTVVSSTSETVLATYQPLATDVVPGASWEAVAYGTFNIGGATRPTLNFKLRWGGVAGTVLCEILVGTNAPTFVGTTLVTGASFDVNGVVTLLTATSATANLNLFYTNSTNLLTAAQSTATATNATTGGASSATAVSISGTGPLVLTAQWNAAQAYDTLTATAPMIYRAA